MTMKSNVARACVKSTYWFALILAMSGNSVQAQTPTITERGILNNASFAFPGMPNSSIARGSLFVVFGTNLGPAGVTQQPRYPLQTALSGVSGKVSVGFQTFDLIPAYLTPTQAGFILPSRTPVGTGSISITKDGVTSASAPINVVESSFGMYSVNQAGSGPGVITGTDFKILAPGSPTRAGETVIIWGTGLGPVSGDELATTAPQVDLTAIPVQVYIGGRRATVLYRGRSSCCTALDVVYVTVPSGVEGCAVPVTVVANDVASNTTTIPIAAANSSVCSNTSGLGANDLQSLLTKSSVLYGSLYLARLTAITPEYSGIAAGVAQYENASAYFARINRATLDIEVRELAPVPLGSCVLTQARAGASPAALPFAYVDAGPAMTLAATTASRQIPRSPEGFYSATLSNSTSTPFFPAAGGTFTWSNGSGGADVGSFSNVTVQLPSDFVWTNVDQLPPNVFRNQNLTVNWSGGGANSYVTISGYSIVDGAAGVTATFNCTERASAGTFTVPPYILSNLPVSRATNPDVRTFLYGVLQVTISGNPGKFTAPGLDYGQAWWHLSTAKLLNYN